MNRRRRSVAGAAGFLLAAVVVAGCGVPMQSAPDQLPAQQLPDIGVSAPPPATPSGDETPGEADVAHVYLIQGNRLVSVSRSVSDPDLPGPVLDSLLAGPTAAEVAKSISTAIPIGTPSLEVTVVERGTALVVVPPRFETLQVADQILVVAQLVYTLTGIDGITGLQMTHGTEVIDIPTGDGRLTPGPVFRAAYSSLAPGNPSASPTPSSSPFRPGGV